MMEVYNSVHEVKLRILLLLMCNEYNWLSADMITALDFITVYGNEFEISAKNLHGDNRFKFSELPSRREIVNKALKVLVKEGMIDVATGDGFKYRINDGGFEFISEFESSYSIEYLESAKESSKVYADYSEAKLYKLIQSKSIIPTMRKE